MPLLCNTHLDTLKKLCMVNVGKHLDTVWFKDILQQLGDKIEAFSFILHPLDDLREYMHMGRINPLSTSICFSIKAFSFKLQNLPCILFNMYHVQDNFYTQKLFSS